MSPPASAWSKPGEEKRLALDEEDPAAGTGGVGRGWEPFFVFFFSETFFSVVHVLTEFKAVCRFCLFW